MNLSPDDKESATNSEKDSNSRPGATAACQSKPREKRSASAIQLLKEDFGVFRQDLLNIFKDKDGKTSESKDKTPLNVLLKDDLDQFKNELTNFTEDITGIIRKGLRKEENSKVKAQEPKERERDDSFKTKDQQEQGDGEDKKTYEIKALEQSRDTEKEDSFKLKASGQEEQSELAEKGESFKIKANEQETEMQHRDKTKDDSFKIKAEEQEGQKEETAIKSSFTIKAHSKSSSKRKANFFKLKAQDHDEKMENCEEFWMESWEMVERHELEPKAEKNDGTFQTNVDFEEEEREPGGEKDGSGDRKKDESKMADAEELVLKQPLISLSSEVGLLRLRSVSENQKRCHLKDDVWAIKNFAQYLTLDPNTANSELLLSDGNRTARRVWSCGHVSTQLTDHMTDHPERFENCPQVLCREGLLDAVYWEVQWTGGADVGVTYNSITRHGPAADGLLGQSRGSWSLECNKDSYTPCHQQRRYKSVCPQPFSHTVGVFLDFEAGALSFYCVSPFSMQHLHTFRAAFTEPLYPGFWVWSWGGSVSLSQVELGWERLLH